MTTTTTYTTEQIRDFAEALALHETHDLPTGQTLRLRRDHDHDLTINNFDYLGKVEPVKPDRYYGCYPHAERPQGFDGSARIMRTRYENYWWQPPDGYATYESDVQRAIWRGACDVVEFGYYVYAVELCEGQDAYRRPIVRAVEALGGIEPMLSHDDEVSVIHDILYRLLDQ